MPTLDLLVRVSNDNESLPYEQARLRPQPGSVVDFVPAGAHVGNVVATSANWRVIRVNMPEGAARMYTAAEAPTLEDIAANIQPRRNAYLLDLSRVTFPPTRAVPDVTLTYGQLQTAMQRLPEERRNPITGRPMR